jgi:hypothetical protein
MRKEPPLIQPQRRLFRAVGSRWRANASFPLRLPREGCSKPASALEPTTAVALGSALSSADIRLSERVENLALGPARLRGLFFVHPQGRSNRLRIKSCGQSFHLSEAPPRAAKAGTALPRA